MKLGIILLTYDRYEYAETTVVSLARNIRWGGPLIFHIADDGSPGDYRDRIHNVVSEHWAGHKIQITNSERCGYGASYNLATQALHREVDLVLPLEDDWECMRPLDLDRYAGAMGSRIQAIRLGYLGLTQPLRGEVAYIAGTPFLLLDPDSPERHVASGHPRLETVGYQRAVGPWPTGLNAGATEFEWCGREAARRGVAWPLDVRPTGGDLFAHIGAVQAREDQR